MPAFAWDRASVEARWLALESCPCTLSMRFKLEGSFLSLELWFPGMGLPGEEREARET